MAVEEAPAFQFYVKEWRSSRAILRMSFAQRGMYLEMLLEQWENLTLPDDPVDVAGIIGGAVAEWKRAWPVLRRKFVTVAPGRIQNVRLEQERNSRRRYKSAATVGGEARAASATRQPDGTFAVGTKNHTASVEREGSGTKNHASHQMETASSVSGQPVNTLGKSHAVSSGHPATTPAAQPAISSTPSSSSSSSSSSSARRAGARAAGADVEESAVSQVMAAYRRLWKRTYGHDCSLMEKPIDVMLLEQQAAAHPVEKLLAAVEAYFTGPDDYVRKAKHPLPLFLRDPLKYLAGTAVELPTVPRGCTHRPACPDGATHTRRDLEDRRKIS